MRKLLVKFVRSITFGGADYARFLYRKVKANSKASGALKSGKEVKIEIGSGSKKGTNGWLTIDVAAGVDILWDLRNGIPFPDNSVDHIYSSHMFEHLPYKHVVGVMKECMRVLKKGGMFNIVVPNARLYIESYIKKDYTWWKSKPSYYKPAWDNTGTPMDLINYIAYLEDEHKYMYDEENLLAIMRSVGMQQVSLRTFDPALDIKDRDHESIYATGIKP